MQGKILYPLPPLAADAHGNAGETAIFLPVPAIPPSGWYVNVQFGVTLTTPQGKIIPQVFNPIACGNVTWDPPGRRDT